jgi:hypothetical protein
MRQSQAAFFTKYFGVYMYLSNLMLMMKVARDHVTSFLSLLSLGNRVGPAGVGWGLYIRSLLSAFVYSHEMHRCSD